MTIAAAYLTSEGVVLGADSSTMVSVQNPEGRSVIQLLNHSQKVFEVGENSRVGACIWGLGSLGQISHRTILARLGDRIEENTTIEQAANILKEIVEPIITGNTVIAPVGYFIGGWDPDTREPKCYHVVSGQTGGMTITPLGLGQAMFSGNPSIFQRVFRGFDASLLETLKSKFSDIVDPDEFEKRFNESVTHLQARGLADLAIREAIDFLYSYIHITIKSEKFKFGPPTCGGLIEVGFISTDRKFRWARHKPFHSAIMEQEGYEHDIE